MIQFMERVGEKLLTRLLPTAKAAAWCTPYNTCVWCAPGNYKRKYVDGDCNIWYGPCGDPRCP